MKTLAQIIAETTPEKLAEIDHQRKSIDRKIALNLPLTEEEIYLQCEQRVWSIKSKLPECEDEFFREFMLKRDPESFGYNELSVDNHIRFGAILIKWDKLMKAGNLDDPLIKAERIEFRYELWHLRKQIPQGGAEFNTSYLRLLEWSKFRSIAVQRIFRKNIKSNEHTFKLNNENIVYNYDSLTHIIARHFAHGMKPYLTSRDHFYGMFAPEELHIWIDRFLSFIDHSQLYTNDSIQEINFRYLKDIYRINIKVETYFEKGKSGKQKRNRLTTFFRLGDKNELKKLEEKFIENGVNKEFSVFVLK